MSTFANSLRLLQGGIMFLDPETAGGRRIVYLPDCSDALTRSLQIRGVHRGSAR
jgi:hypothetical protein